MQAESWQHHTQPVTYKWSCRECRCCVLASQCVVATMELFKCLLGVVVVLFLDCFVVSQRQWSLPSRKHQALLPNWPSLKQQQQPQHQPVPPTVPPPTEPSDKCQVQQDDKIYCGPEGVTPERCKELNCCFDGQQCYYGKAGERIAEQFLCNHT